MRPVLERGVAARIAVDRLEEVAVARAWIGCSVCWLETPVFAVYQSPSRGAILSSRIVHTVGAPT
jgi:hypothetical protein